MDTLRGVFPTVPTEALLRVLEVCDQSVALASTWLLENDWESLMSENEDAEEEKEEEEEKEDTSDSATPTTSQTAGSMVVSTGVRIRSNEDTITGVFPFQEELDDEEEEEEEEEEDDEDEEDVYYDSEDETGFRMGGIPPLAKRIKVSKSEGRTGDDSFWVAFDDQVMIKSMIELLNTTLSKLAHSKVVLLCQPAHQLDESEATVKLQSIVSSGEKEDTDEDVSGSGRSATTSRGIALSRLLNDNSIRGETGKVVGSSESSTAIREGSTVRKRKRKEAGEDSTQPGFFAYFFPVRELDMVWRTVLHAHLFKGRFGEKIEFHTASEGPFSKRDFDELMHIQSSGLLGLSPLATLKCCLLLPCLAEEEEIFRVGKNIHNLLKVQGNLYYGISNILDETFTSDDSKMTEKCFRQFAHYRVKENASSNDSPRPRKAVVDPYMSYQQPRKSSYSLECLEGDKWTCRFSS